MINRDNWKTLQRYLADMADVEQFNKSTIDGAYSCLRHFLEWADETPLAKVADKRPTFQQYVMALGFSNSSIARILGDARRLLVWARSNNQKRFNIPDRYLRSLHPPRLPETRKPHEHYTPNDVRRLLDVQPRSLAMQRDQAAVALLFLSGMRSGAFVTLAVDCVDLVNCEVKQWPEMGVRPKLGKGQTLFLLQSLPDLLEHVKRWDAIVRDEFPGNALWYAPMDPPCGDKAAPTATGSAGFRGRYNGLRDGLISLCKAAKMPYKSPHKLRHGFAVYGLMMARDMADMTAISHNMGHADLKVTLGIYAVLDDAEVKARISKLGVES